MFQSTKDVGLAITSSDEDQPADADFRRYALGRLVLCETLRRLQQHVAKSIFVETDNYRNTAFRLYESIGFREIRDVLVYRKDYNDAVG